MSEPSRSIADTMAAYAHRRAIYDRLLRAVMPWDDVHLEWLCGQLEAGNITPPVDEGCPGPGACHGTQGWCDSCGDVAGVCDDDGCEVHHCTGCGMITAERIDGVPWCPDCRVENVGDDEEAASGEDSDAE